jgi:predicted enzyme related to lactoylglutathione lyase
MTEEEWMMDESTSNTGIGTLYAFVLDVNDLDTCGQFWSQVLGAEILYQDQRYVRLGHKGRHPSLLLQKVPEGHAAKNRAHIDLDVSDLDAAVSRAQTLGGRTLRAVNEYGIAWVVMADPDGNEFCLIKHTR